MVRCFINCFPWRRRRRTRNKQSNCKDRGIQRCNEEEGSSSSRGALPQAEVNAPSERDLVRHESCVQAEYSQYLEEVKCPPHLKTALSQKMARVLQAQCSSFLEKERDSRERCNQYALLNGVFGYQQKQSTPFIKKACVRPLGCETCLLLPIKMQLFGLKTHSGLFNHPALRIVADCLQVLQRKRWDDHLQGLNDIWEVKYTGRANYVHEILIKVCGLGNVPSWKISRNNRIIPRLGSNIFTRNYGIPTSTGDGSLELLLHRLLPLQFRKPKLVKTCLEGRISAPNDLAVQTSRDCNVLLQPLCSYQSHPVPPALATVLLLSQQLSILRRNEHLCNSVLHVLHVGHPTVTPFQRWKPKSSRLFREGMHPWEKALVPADSFVSSTVQMKENHVLLEINDESTSTTTRYSIDLNQLQADASEAQGKEKNTVSLQTEHQQACLKNASQQSIVDVIAVQAVTNTVHGHRAEEGLVPCNAEKDRFKDAVSDAMSDAVPPSASQVRRAQDIKENNKLALLKGTLVHSWEAYLAHLPPDHRQLLIDLWPKFMRQKTSLGIDLAKVLEQEVEVSLYLGSREKSGILAGDEESFDVFQDLYDPIVRSLHGELQIKYCGRCLDKMYSNLEDITFERLDPAIIKYIKITFHRSVRGFRFAPFLSMQDRSLIFQLMKDCQAVEEGNFIPIDTSDEEQKTFLVHRRLHRHSTSLGHHHQWPLGRAIILHERDEEQCLVKVNFKEHLDIVTTRRDNDTKLAFLKALKVEQAIHHHLTSYGLDFCHHEKYGFLNARMENLGLAMTVGVRVVLDELSQLNIFEDLIKHFRFRCGKRVWRKGPQQEFMEMESIETFVDNEVDLLQQIHNKVLQLVEIERELAKGCDVSNLLPPHLVEVYREHQEKTEFWPGQEGEAIVEGKISDPRKNDNPSSENDFTTESVDSHFNLPTCSSTSPTYSQASDQRKAIASSPNSCSKPADSRFSQSKRRGKRGRQRCKEGQATEFDCSNEAQANTVTPNDCATKSGVTRILRRGETMELLQTEPVMPPGDCTNANAFAVPGPDPLTPVSASVNNSGCHQADSAAREATGSASDVGSFAAFPTSPTISEGPKLPNTPSSSTVPKTVKRVSFDVSCRKNEGKSQKPRKQSKNSSLEACQKQ